MPNVTADTSLFSRPSAPEPAVPHSAVPHSAVPHSAVPHSAVPHAGAPERAFPHPAEPHSATPTPRRWAGNALLAIAVIHSGFGLLAGARIISDPQLYALVGDRVLLLEMRPPLGSGAPLDLAHVALFWFLTFGIALLPLGALIRHLERTGQPVPRSLSWQLAALAVTGGIFLPASGFWLALLPAWNIWRRN